MFTYRFELNFQHNSYDRVLKITGIRKSTSELFTWVVFLNPADAVLVNLFGFLGQHGILQVCSVEAHCKPENILDRNFTAYSWLFDFNDKQDRICFENQRQSL